MAEEATEAPAAVEAEDQPSTSGAPNGTSAEAPQEQATEAPDVFGDNFDPSTLPDELQPAYKQLRGDYTRKTQELAEQRKQADSVNALFTDLQSEDPSDRASALQWMAQNGLLTEEQVAEHFGWEIEPATDDEQDPLDPVEELRRQFEEDRNKRQEAENAKAQQEWAQAEDKRINDELDSLGDGKLSQRARDLIFRNALVAAQQGLTEGIDVKSAFEEMEAEWTDRQKQWRDGKSTAQPTAQGGVAATEAPDLDSMSDSDRHAWLQEQVRLREAGT